MRSIRFTLVVVLLVALSSLPTAIAQDDGWSEHAEAAREAHDNGNLAEAERLLRLALSEVERLGKDQPNTAEVLDDLK
jgi:hypothetical protein